MDPNDLTENNVGYVRHSPQDNSSYMTMDQSTIPPLPPLLDSRDGTEYIVPSVFALIFIFGLVGNGTLIYIVARNKSLQNTPNIFIVSLATADLLLILVAVPFSATLFTFTYWPYGKFMCKLNYFMQTLSLGVSVFTLVALSGERYMAIVHPMNQHMSSTTKRTSLIAVGIWVLSGLLAAMDIVKTELIHHEDENRTHVYIFCLVQPNNETDTYARFRTMFRFSVYFAVPVLVICSFYIRMARILIKSSESMPGNSSSQATRQLEARKKVAKVVLSFVVVFVLCWLPYYMYRIWYYFLPGEFNKFWLTFKVLAFCLAFLNSCANPFALYFLSKQFRGYYNKYLFCCCTTRRANQKGEYATTLLQLRRPAAREPNNTTFETTNSVM